MKLGLIIAEYNSIDFIQRCLKAWIEYKENHPDNLVIALADVKFKETEDTNHKDNSNDGSLEYLESLKIKGLIDHLEVCKPGLQEHEARNTLIDYVTSQKVDYVITWGIDEIITIPQIEQIVNHIDNEPFINWFSIGYKNYVFDDQHYVLGFEPPRVFKVNTNRYVLSHFYFDDDVEYKEGERRLSYKFLPSQKIPKILVDHYTWSDPVRSKAKIEYQNRHFAHGAGCSFRYNKEKDTIEFNPDYYKKTGQLEPTVFEK